MRDLSADLDIPFALPDVGVAEREAVDLAMRSGWITTGPVTKNFEESFKSYIHAPGDTIAVNSATAGLHLVLEACGVRPGDEVILPTWTFTATAEVVRYLGGTPILVDVDSSTYNLDLNLLNDCITSRTRVIVPVHMAGRSVDVGAIREIVGHRPIRIVEDAAHALPSATKGALVGALVHSDAAVFSFYATKPITTGEGGMISIQDAAMASRMRIMRLHGIDRDVFARYSRAGASWEYDVVAPGYKYNMTDMAAALGNVQLSRSDQMHRRRSEIANIYTQAFESLPLKLPPLPAQGDIHSWHLYQVQILPESRLDRDGLWKELNSHRIGSSIHYTPLHKLTYWRESLDLQDNDFPVASELFKRTLSLPIYSAMTDDQIGRVIDSVRKALL